MVTRAPFLRTQFGGYFHRDIPEEDTELTHVGPRTPCGENFRRFWKQLSAYRRRKIRHWTSSSCEKLADSSPRPILRIRR
jgi:hypothetical protein